MPEPTVLFALGRLGLVVYAGLATALMTTCLTLQAIAAFQRRATGRRSAAPDARPAARRPLFLRLDTELSAD